MLNDYDTVEDCLEVFVGLQPIDNPFTIEKSDYGIMSSIARQVFRGVPLSDRQYGLVKQKLMSYNNDWIERGVEDLEDRLMKLRTPLRKIDRSKYIKLIDNNLVLRFPFSKKLILKLEKITWSHRNYHEHVKGSHVHTFAFKEKILEDLIDTFSNFEIDKELQEYYNKIKYIKNNPQEFLPCVYNNELHNLDSNHVEKLHNMFGKPRENNLLFYQDRSFMYNLNVLDYYKKEENLLHKIAQRSSHAVFVNSEIHELTDLFTSLIYLRRLPILIGLSEKNSVNDLEEIHSNLYTLNPNLKHSVLFRYPNSDDYGKRFNDYIRNNNLNISLDKPVDVVYINIDANKIPKPLFESNIQFQSVLSIQSGYTGRIISNYLLCLSDLFISYSGGISPMLRNELVEI